MKRLVDSQEMKRCDGNTIGHYGIPSEVLMERAALSVYEEIRSRFPQPSTRILILCGSGNNGGDGLALARLLHLAGYAAEILFPMNEAKMTQEAALQYRIARKYHVPEVGCAMADAPPQEAHGGCSQAIAAAYGGYSRAIAAEHGGCGQAIAAPHGGCGQAIAAAHGGCGQAIAAAHGGCSRAIAAEHGGESGRNMAPHHGESEENPAPAASRQPRDSELWENVLAERDYDVIVDALFGIGLSRNIEGMLHSLICCLNEKNAYRIAVDIPSGISADDGEVMGTAFSADLTVTFGFAKTGQLLYPGAGYCGELLVKEMGIDQNSFLGDEPMGGYLDRAEAGPLLPERKPYSNKGSYGRTLVIAGSPGMAGAAYLSAKAAYYSGCGLVRILTPEENRGILLTKLPEAIVTVYRSSDTESIPLAECLDWADAVLLGPGIGTDGTAEFLVKETLKRQEIPTAIDADGLNILAKDRKLLSALGENCVATPHLGEMSRLAGKDIPDIQDHLLRTARDFSGKYGIVCVLKDARTVISLPDGHFYVNVTGNHGMATGGSGDVLAGLLAGFLAQGLSTGTAAALACYIHGTAGDLAAGRKGAYSMLAGDILEDIPNAIEDCRRAAGGAFSGRKESRSDLR